MRRRYLLFVTYQDRQSEEGLAYAIDLARILGKGLSILMVREARGIFGGFSDAMVAASFAEEGEHETAVDIMRTAETDTELKERADSLAARCREAGVNVEIKASRHDATAAIKGSLKGDDGIEMILLGPNVTESENFTAKRLAKLIKTVTMPIVTIARQTCAA